MFRAVMSAAFAVIFALTAGTQAGTTIRIWKIGSPHTGDTPHPNVPSELAREAGYRGWRLSIDAIPAQGFADRFFVAARAGSAPDLLVFDNLGIINGITTGTGTFVGIGEDPVIRSQLVQVTGSFDEVLGPARGWTFLFTSSSNHAAARELALRTPRCAGPPGAQIPPSDLAVPEVAAAYLAGDSGAILLHADAARLPAMKTNVEERRVANVAVCGCWGNERLAFVTVNASYQADTTIGHASLLLVFRKISRWQLLVASRDPVSNRQFVAQLPSLSRMLDREMPAGPVPMPATLRSPENGRFPIPANAERFGDFEWQSSTSDDVVAEIAEFSYQDDARLFLLHAQDPGVLRRISAGRLWTTRGEWAWRVWSITGSGEVAFSEARTFVH